MTEGVRRVVAAAPWGTARRLTALVADEQGKRGRLLAEQIAVHPAWGRWAEVTRAEAARGREEREAWLEGQRTAGVLLDSRSVVMAFGVEEELVARGWDHGWPAPPARASMAGRWPGSRDGSWPDRVTANLDHDLVTRVVAACWWTSEPAIMALGAWRDVNPEVIVSRLRGGDAAAVAEYEALADQVITPGAIWRAGLARVLG